MPDITLCRNAECPMRNGCYRYLCKPGDWQSWGIFPAWPVCTRWSPYAPEWRVTGPTHDVDTVWHVPIGGGPGPEGYPGAYSYTLPQTCGPAHWVRHKGQPTCTADEVPR